MLEKLILVAVGGSIGALLRYFVSNATFYLFGVGFPWGTLAANVIGCFLIGVAVGVSERVPYSPKAALFITTGVLGAFTTFSAFGAETFVLLREGDIALGVLNIFGSNVAGLAGVVLGFVVGSAVSVESGGTL